MNETLFDNLPGQHRTDDHASSVAAAYAKLGKRGNQRWHLLKAHYDRHHTDRPYVGSRTSGLTDEEAAIAINAPMRSCWWKRCGELRAAGFLEDTGLERRTTTGVLAKVWRVTPAGIAVFEQSLRS